MRLSILLRVVVVFLFSFWATERGSLAGRENFSRAYTPYEDPAIAKWVTQLSDADGAKADQALLKLIVLGRAAFDELFKAIQSQAEFHGLGMNSELDESIEETRSVGYVALYLIRIVCSPQAKGGHERLLYLGHKQVTKNLALKTSTVINADQYVDISEAITAYTDWYSRVRAGEVRVEAIDAALRKAGFRWGGL